MGAYKQIAIAVDLNDGIRKALHPCLVNTRRSALRQEQPMAKAIRPHESGDIRTAMNRTFRMSHR